MPAKQCVTDQPQQNKALHPTAYSAIHFVRSSLHSFRFRRRVSWSLCCLRATWLRVVCSEVWNNNGMRQRKSDGRFTVIEILVVIAILFLLLGLLSPVVRRVDKNYAMIFT